MAAQAEVADMVAEEEMEEQVEFQEKILLLTPEEMGETAARAVVADMELPEVLAASEAEEIAVNHMQTETMEEMEEKVVVADMAQMGMEEQAEQGGMQKPNQLIMGRTEELLLVAVALLAQAEMVARV